LNRTNAQRAAVGFVAATLTFSASYYRCVRASQQPKGSPIWSARQDVALNGILPIELDERSQRQLRAQREHEQFEARRSADSIA